MSWPREWSICWGKCISLYSRYEWFSPSILVLFPPILNLYCLLIGICDALGLHLRDCVIDVFHYGSLYKLFSFLWNRHSLFLGLLELLSLCFLMIFYLVISIWIMHSSFSPFFYFIYAIPFAYCSLTLYNKNLTFYFTN